MFDATLRLHIDVDEGAYRGQESKDDLLSVFKSMAVRVGVKPVPEPPFEPASAIKVRASILHRPLWDSSDATAEDNWRHVVVPALKDALPKVQRDLSRCAEPAWYRNTDLHLLSFPRFDIQVDPYVLSFKTSDSFSVPDCIIENLERFRILLNAGAFGTKDVLRVDLPFIDMEALWAAYNAELEAQAQADCQEESELSEIVGLSAESADAEEGAPATIAGLDGDSVDAADDALQDEESASEETPPAIDYSVWGITLRDGTFFLFDAAKGIVLES